MIETVFLVPRLNEASVACGGCCPVPAEAILLPELELVAGVSEAEADWQSGQVIVRHAPEVDPAELASLLEELSYPAESWTTRHAETGESPRRGAAFQTKPEYQRA